VSARFCRRCGAQLLWGVLQGDDRPRAYCAVCGHVEYNNPRVRAGCLARTTEGEVVLRTVLLLPGERLQAGALRAIAAPLPEEQLLLYCGITDRVEAEICLVFRALRSIPPGARPGRGEDASPGWGSFLLERFAEDMQSAVMPVYTAEVEGAGLRFAAVHRD